MSTPYDAEWLEYDDDTRPAPWWQPCSCKSRCGDDGDTEGPGVCKGLPRQPREPLVEIVLVPRWPSTEREQEA